MSDNTETGTFVGNAFHTFTTCEKCDKRRVRYQGVVVAHEGGVWMVQYFDWTAGQPTTRQVVTSIDLLDWQFYEDAEAMNFWYEHRYRGCDCE